MEPTIIFQSALIGFAVLTVLLAVRLRIKQRKRDQFMAEMEALAQQAKDGLKELDLEDEAFTKNMQRIDDIRSTSGIHSRHAALLRQYAALTKRHTTVTIDITYFSLCNYCLNHEDISVPEVISDEHINFYESLSDYWVTNLSMVREEYDNIAAYGFANIEDADLILSLVRNRGIYSVESLKSGVQQMKTVETTALTDGVL